jgi:hypothetical protein
MRSRTQRMPDFSREGILYKSKMTQAVSQAFMWYTVYSKIPEYIFNELGFALVEERLLEDYEYPDNPL